MTEHIWNSAALIYRFVSDDRADDDDDDDDNPSKNTTAQKHTPPHETERNTDSESIPDFCMRRLCKSKHDYDPNHMHYTIMHEEYTKLMMMLCGNAEADRHVGHNDDADGDTSHFRKRVPKTFNFSSDGNSHNNLRGQQRCETLPADAKQTSKQTRTAASIRMSVFFGMRQ